MTNRDPEYGKLQKTVIIGTDGRAHESLLLQSSKLMLPYGTVWLPDISKLVSSGHNMKKFA
jgi:hypothetical protein